MTDIQAVRDTLLATAQSGSVINSPFVSTEPIDAMHQFAAHIDRTSLARRVHLKLSDTTEITLDARNRRLFQFCATSAARTDHALRQSAPMTLCTAEDSKEIAQHLKALLDGNSVVRHRIVDDPAITFPTTSGISTAVIFQHLDESPRRHGPINLEALLINLIEKTPSAVLGACVLASEEIVVIVGSDEQVLGMVEQAKPVLGGSDMALSPAPCTVQSGGMCALNWGGPNTGQLLVINAGQKTGLVLVEAKHGTDLLGALRPRWKFGV